MDKPRFYALPVQFLGGPIVSHLTPNFFRVRISVRISRTGNAQLLRSKPSYTHWDRKDLDRSIGGPLLTKWGDRYLVGGRKTTQAGAKTSLCWLVDDQLHEFAELPSGGDNSYPGFIELAPNRALVSYYSSHERDAAGKVITVIYLAELELVP